MELIERFVIKYYGTTIRKLGGIGATDKIFAILKKRFGENVLVDFETSLKQAQEKERSLIKRRGKYKPLPTYHHYLPPSPERDLYISSLRRKGMANAEIASCIGVSPRRIAQILRRIDRKKIRIVK